MEARDPLRRRSSSVSSEHDANLLMSPGSNATAESSSTTTTTTTTTTPIDTPQCSPPDPLLDDYSSLDALHDAALKAYQASRKGSFASAYLLPPNAEDSPSSPLPDVPEGLIAFIRVASERNIAATRSRSRSHSRTDDLLHQFSSQDLPLKNPERGNLATVTPANLRNSNNGSDEPALQKASSFSSISSCDSESSLHLTEEATQLSYERSKVWFLNYVLRDKASRKVFMLYLKRRQCAENLMFWLDVERYKKIEDAEELRAKAKSLQESYLIPGISPYELNISHDLRRNVEQALVNPGPETFNEVQKAVYLLMVHGTFDYFINVEQVRAKKATKQESGKVKSETAPPKLDNTTGNNNNNKTKERSLTVSSTESDGDSQSSSRKRRSNTLPTGGPKDLTQAVKKESKKKEKCIIS